MCVGCHKRSEQTSLLRFIATSDKSIQVDAGCRDGQRGAWLCPVPQCVETAIRRGGFRRAFRGQINVCTDDLFRQVDGVLASRVEQSMQSGRRAGAVVPAVGNDRGSCVEWGDPSTQWTVKEDHWHAKFATATEHYRQWSKKFRDLPSRANASQGCM
jgi:predicted RNA-binding protein YlxR (DUF448 family)